MASQITSLMIAYPTVYSGADQRKHQSSASLAFVRGIHRWPVNSLQKGPVARKMVPFDDVIIWALLIYSLSTPMRFRRTSNGCKRRIVIIGEPILLQYTSWPETAMGLLSMYKVQLQRTTSAPLVYYDEDKKIPRHIMKPYCLKGTATSVSDTLSDECRVLISPSTFILLHCLAGKWIPIPSHNNL